MARTTDTFHSLHHTSMKEHALPKLLLVAVVCSLVLVFAGCGEQAPSGEAALPLAAAAPDSMASFGTEHPYVGISELTCVMDDFGTHIQQGDSAAHDPIGTKSSLLTIGVGALQKAVTAAGGCGVAGPVTHGVVVHYGLDSNHELAVALQVLCLPYDSTTKTYTYPDSKDLYLPGVQGKLTLVKDGLLAWKAAGGQGAAYANRVFIDRDNNGTWTAFEKNMDVNSSIFPYEGRLSSLIADNGLDSTSMLVLVPISVPRSRTPKEGGGYIEKDYHQSIAWMPKDVAVNDTTYGTALYKHKAADLGNPCPEYCADVAFQFMSQGLEPRSGCGQ